MSPPEDVGVPSPRIPDGHSLLLYSSDEHRWASLAAWTLEGLRQGQQVIFTAMTDSASRSVRGALESEGVDVDAALASRQLRFVDLAEILPEGGQEAVVTAALAEGFPGLRIIGAADDALERMSRQEYELLEAEMDELCNRYPLSALCQYDDALVAGRLPSVLASHPIVADELGMLVTRPGPAGHLAADLVGEFDGGNAEVLHEALAHAGRARPPFETIEIDLAGLTFLSVAAGRALLDGTTAFRDAGGRVTLRGADRHLTQVLTLLRVADHAGIALDGRHR